MSDIINIIDKVQILIYKHWSTFNTSPEWLIIDYATYKEIKVLFL